MYAYLLTIYTKIILRVLSKRSKEHLVHIFENKTIRKGAIYCYACESHWDPSIKKYHKPSYLIGKISNSEYIPNVFVSDLIRSYLNEPDKLNDHQKLMVKTVLNHYGNNVCNNLHKPKVMEGMKTAEAIFIGPEIVFGAITKKYNIAKKLIVAFGKDVADDILSIAWFLASEGDALINSDVWLEWFENPGKHTITSQRISEILELMEYDDIMTFYKLWLEEFSKTKNYIIYDLTSIFYYGKNLSLVDYGYSKEKDGLPQINYALVCLRDTGMPLFSWAMNGSVSDVKTLETMLEFLNKLGYFPNCLMMDRAFGSNGNILHMLRHNQKFLQSLKIDRNWIKDLLDKNIDIRFDPRLLISDDDRDFRASTVKCKFINQIETLKNGNKRESIQVIPQEHKYNSANPNIDVKEQYSCYLHILFSNSLVSNSADKLLKDIKNEIFRLENDDSATIDDNYKPYLTITKSKYARKRKIDINIKEIKKSSINYSGNICFLTNDPEIKNAQKAFDEYSTRDYIEKDFDEMKNGLDMKRLRISNNKRLNPRLFIQFLAEIFMREIRVALKKCPETNKLTRTQIFESIKGIYKIKFNGKYKDVYPKLTKKQRDILSALKIAYNH
jgi:transposase